MTITLEEFRSIVDNTKARLPKDSFPETAKTFVGLDDSQNYQRSEITELLFERVTSAFKTGHRMVFDHCKALITELIHENVIHNAPLDPYFEILSAVKDAMRSNAIETKVQGDWKMAVQLAMDYSEWCGQVHRPQYELMYKAEITSAQAMRRTKGIGESGRAEKIPVTLHGEREKVIVRVIENAVIRMGGVEVARRLFAMLEPKFDAVQMRYHDVNQFSFTAPLQARVPTGLLLNLAAKHPVAKKPLKQSDNDWAYLIQLSKDYASLYCVQPASYMDTLFTDAISLLPIMRKLSLHDSLFSPAQMRPADVVRVLRGLIAGLRTTKKIPEAAEIEVTKIISIIEGLQRLIGESRGPFQFKGGEVVTCCKEVAPDDVQKILERVLAHPKNGANVNFRLPNEVPDESLPRPERAGPNFGDHPLLMIDHDRYLLLDHYICAPAMIEAVLAQLRDFGVDTDMGYAIEGLLISELASHGILVKSGKYEVGKQTWECDLVIETSKRIIFVETKKKSLTRAARAGLDEALLADMADSLVSATLQSGRHQLQIKRNGYLTLLNPAGQTETIELRDRRVERIAVTLPDFGSFQDRALIDQILSSQLAITFSTSDSSFSKKINKVNAKLLELQDFNVSLYEQEGRPESWRPFFNCWFLSIPQFLMLLDGVNDAEQFDAELMRTRHMTLGTKDFYFEYHYAKRLASA
jgi:hypothetical protein